MVELLTSFYWKLDSQMSSNSNKKRNKIHFLCLFWIESSKNMAGGEWKCFKGKKANESTSSSSANSSSGNLDPSETLWSHCFSQILDIFEIFLFLTVAFIYSPLVPFRSNTNSPQVGFVIYLLYSSQVITSIKYNIC